MFVNLWNAIDACIHQTATEMNWKLGAFSLVQFKGINVIASKHNIEDFDVITRYRIHISIRYEIVQCSAPCNEQTKKTTKLRKKKTTMIMMMMTEKRNEMIVIKTTVIVWMPLRDWWVGVCMVLNFSHCKNTHITINTNDVKNFKHFHFTHWHVCVCVCEVVCPFIALHFICTFPAITNHMMYTYGANS